MVRVALVLALAGCGRAECEPVITGGTGAERANVHSQRYDTSDGEAGCRWILDRDRWTSLRCADASRQVFAYDDGLWSARLADGVLTLGVWTVE